MVLWSFHFPLLAKQIHLKKKNLNSNVCPYLKIQNAARWTQISLLLEHKPYIQLCMQPTIDYKDSPARDMMNASRLIPVCVVVEKI